LSLEPIGGLITVSTFNLSCGKVIIGVLLLDPDALHGISSVWRRAFSLMKWCAIARADAKHPIEFTYHTVTVISNLFRFPWGAG